MIKLNWNLEKTKTKILPKETLLLMFVFFLLKNFNLPSVFVLLHFQSILVAYNVFVFQCFCPVVAVNYNNKDILILDETCNFIHEL